MINYLAFFLFLTCLVLRVLPRILWPVFSGSDLQFHYYYIDLIKKNNHRLPARDLRVLGGRNICDYPAFYHQLLSFLPHKGLVFSDKFAGCVFDLLNGFVVIFLLSLVTKITFTVGCLILAGYIIAPGLTFSFIGPRPFSLTPRNFAECIFCLGIFCVLLSVGQSIEYSIMWLFFASLAFSILLLSSQFGAQVLACLLIFGFLYIKIVPVILIAIILALVFSKGCFFERVKAQVDHLVWYLKYNYNFVKHKSNFSQLMRFLKEKNLRGVFYEIVFYNQALTTLVRHSTYFIAIIWGSWLWYGNHLLPIQKASWLILLAILPAFIITNFGKARVLGEAERYVEFVYPLQMFLFLSFILPGYMYLVLSILLLYNIVWYLYNLYQIKHQYASCYSYEALLQHLNGTNIILLCLNSTDSYAFLRRTHAKIVGHLIHFSLKAPYYQFFQKFFVQYPFVQPKSIAALTTEYNVTHILHNKKIKSAEIYQYDSVINDIKQFKKIYEDAHYSLYGRV